MLLAKPKNVHPTISNTGLKEDALESTFFKAKNYIFKFILPSLLIVTLLGFLMSSGLPSFYKAPGTVSFNDHGNTISNHNDGWADGVFTGGYDLDDAMVNGEYQSDGDGDNGDRPIIN